MPCYDVGVCDLGIMVNTGVSFVLVGLFLGFSYVNGLPAAPPALNKIPQVPQLPQVPQVPLLPTLRPLTPGQVKNCTVNDYDKVLCGEPGINATRCNAINCCFDGQQCYYGKMGKFGVLFDLILW